MEFRHECFQRGKPELLSNIYRKKQTPKKANSSPSALQDNKSTIIPGLELREENENLKGMNKILLEEVMRLRDQQKQVK